MRKMGILNMVIGIAILGTVFIYDIRDTPGFLLFFLGFSILISGVVLTKKIRDFVINFIFNFL